MYDNDIYGPEFRPPGRAGGMQQDVYNQLLPKKLRKIAQQTQVGHFQVGRREGLGGIWKVNISVEDTDVFFFQLILLGKNW